MSHYLFGEQIQGRQLETLPRRASCSRCAISPVYTWTGLWLSRQGGVNDRRAECAWRAVLRNDVHVTRDRRVWCRASQKNLPRADNEKWRIKLGKAQHRTGVKLQDVRL
jgi:hypothetical protein